MPAGTVAGQAGTIGQAFLQVIVYGVGLALFVAFLWVMFNLGKYRYKTIVYEQVGNDVERWKTRSGVVYNKKQGKKELRIRKSWLKFWRYWTKPVPSNKYFHKSTKGKKQIILTKVGDHASDLHFTLPPNPSLDEFKNKNGNPMLQPSDHKALNWHVQTQKAKAQRFRQEMTWKKLALPIAGYVGLAICLVFAFIYGSQSLTQMSGDAKGISNNLKQMQEMQKETASILQGVQTPQTATNPGEQQQQEQQQKKQQQDESGVGGLVDAAQNPDNQGGGS